MITSQESIEYRLLDGLRDDTPPYGSIGPFVTGEMIKTYLAPIVAYDTGYEARAALSFAVSTGLPEAVDLIVTASEQESEGEIFDWAVEAAQRMREGTGLDASSFNGGPEDWVRDDIEILQAQVAYSAANWHKTALERGGEIDPETLSVLGTVYDRSVAFDPKNADYVKAQYPEFLKAVASL